MASTFRTRWNLQVLLIIFTAVIVSYTLIRMGVIELPAPAPKNNKDCPTSALLSTNKDDNRMKIVNYPLVDSTSYLSRLGLQDVDKTPEFDGNPVVVTAASANRFSNLYHLIKHLRATLRPILKIYVYDLGLTKDQRVMLSKETDIVCRVFPFENYPAFIKESIPSIAWKPIVIQTMLQEFGFVVWMDSAIYIPDGNIEGGIEIARREGIAVSHGGSNDDHKNLAYQTDILTFKALGEEPCAFEKLYPFKAALIFVKRSPFTYKYIMRPWVSCALQKSCISADFRFYSRCDFADRYGYCHRFDQSVLSVILNRLFYQNTEAINIGNSVRWTKCYNREKVVVSNEFVFAEIEDPSIQCPEMKYVSAPHQ